MIAKRRVKGRNLGLECRKIVRFIKRSLKE